MKNKKNFLTWILIVLVAFLVVAIFANKNGKPVEENFEEAEPINTLLMLIEFEKMDGVLQWEKELDKRNLSALVKVQDNLLIESPEDFKRLSDKGYEIAGGYDISPFWGMSYEEQYGHLKASKDLVEAVTGKKMRIFGSRYFAYDETTLRAADDLEIEYILGRGVNDVEAVIYQPEEYNVKIISVTNVDVGEPMGRGSLCDYSLWARGADAEEFGVIIDESLEKNPDNMIIVSHSYLGGTRLEWWNEYERVLGSNRINWHSFDDWANNQNPVILPNAEIPVNDEVKYVEANPAKPMDEYEPIPWLEDCETEMTIDGELLCL